MLRFRTTALAAWLTAGALSAWASAPLVRDAWPRHVPISVEPSASSAAPPLSPESQVGLPAPVTGATLGAITLALSRRRG